MQAIVIGCDVIGLRYVKSNKLFKLTTDEEHQCNPTHTVMLPLCILAFLSYVGASPTPIPGPIPTPPTTVHAAPPAQPTVFSTRRNILRDLDGDINSILNGLGSDIPSYVASGVPNFFQDFPTGTAVQSSLGLSDGDLAALPTQVLNLP